MTEEQEKFLDEFVKGTPIWAEAIKQTLGTYEGRPMCSICGMFPDNMMKLIPIIEELREKAWQYDSLKD